jgi:rubrerythrin
VTRPVRVLGPACHAYRLAGALAAAGAHITGVHRRHDTRHDGGYRGTLHLLATPPRWTCANCGASFAGPLCPNCNGVAA